MRELKRSSGLDMTGKERLYWLSGARLDMCCESRKGAELLHSDALQDLANMIESGDRGCGLLARLYTWHAECLLALVFVSVGYFEPLDAGYDVG